MTRVSKNNNTLKDSLKCVCKKYPDIVFAYLFGSYATGEQTAMSDIDLAIYLKSESEFNFNKLLLFHGDCCRALKRNDVDVLVLNTAKNLILLQDIILTGKIIYNANQTILDDFELRTLHAVHDFRERNSWEKTL
jgi:predicted nucleotidyltransferase